MDPVVFFGFYRSLSLDSLSLSDLSLEDEECFLAILLVMDLPMFLYV